VDATVQNGELRAALDALIAAKRAGAELDRGPRIPVIGCFIASEIARLEDPGSVRAESKQSIEPLNQLFRSTLTEVW
jgi:hypothetical protein